MVVSVWNQCVVLLALLCFHVVSCVDLLNLQYTHEVRLERRVTLAWKIEQEEGERGERGEGVAHFRVRALTRGWVAVAFSAKGEMIGSDAYIGFYSENDEQLVFDGYLGAKKVACPGACIDTLMGGIDNVIAFNTTEDREEGVTTIYFTRNLTSYDHLDRNITVNESIYVLYAFSADNTDKIAHHSVTNRGTVQINFSTGRMKPHSDKAVLVTHGIIMFAVWNVITPISVMFMRYYTPKKIAMRIHLGLQNFVVAGSLSLTFLALIYTTTHFNSAHSILGFVFLILCSLQGYIGNSIVSTPYYVYIQTNFDSIHIFVFPPPFLKCSKGKKQYKFPRIVRKVSAFIHPYLGRVLFILSFACVWTGMYLFSHGTWFQYVFWSWLGVIVLFFVILEVLKRYLKRLKQMIKPIQMDSQGNNVLTVKVAEQPSSPPTQSPISPESIEVIPIKAMKQATTHKTNTVIVVFAMMTGGILVAGAVGIVYAAFWSKGQLPPNYLSL